MAAQHEDSFFIALRYGERTDWRKNVLASGTAEVVRDGKTYAVDRPETVAMTEATRYFRPEEPRLHGRFKMESGLRVHCS